MKLTRRQTEAVAAVAGLTERHGIPPTAREVGDELGIHYTSAAELLRAAAERGGLEYTPGACRSWRVARKPQRPAAGRGSRASSSPGLSGKRSAG